MTRRPYLLGLTGSIGMGKSTVARMFAEAGVPVWDADGAVDRLYGPGGGGAAALADILAGVAAPDGSADRAALRRAVVADPAILPRIEARIHPLVAADRRAFVAAQAGAQPPADIVLCDIPLLFETGAEAALDGVLVVTAPLKVQRARVLARPGMTEAMLARILARQMPDADKRARADFVLRTDRGLATARTEAQSVLARIRRGRDIA